MVLLPRTTASRAILAGGIGVVLLGGVAVFVLWSEGPEATRRREFRQLMSNLSSPDTTVVTQAALEIPLVHGTLLSDSGRLRVAAALFSGDNLRSARSEEWLDSSRTFWQGIMVLKDPEGLRIFPTVLTQLRHQYLVTKAPRERPKDLRHLAEGEAGPWMRGAMEDLVAKLFPPREELGAFLWDRVNLEEMAGMGSEALHSFQQLSYDRVRNHWEFDTRITYLLLKADLLGRIRRLFPPELMRADEDLEESLSHLSDPELAPFRDYEDGAMAHLLDGIQLLHREKLLEATAAFTRYIKLGPDAEGEGVATLASRSPQLATYLRALSRLGAASATFRVAQGISLAPQNTRLALRGALDLRMARLAAGLSLREEFDLLATQLAREGRETTSLLSAAKEMVWGERERGAALLREAISVHPDLPDEAAWSDLAHGVVPPAPKAFFEMGQICDELGDIPCLERTIERLKFAVEAESDEAYLIFLGAVLRLRRGQVVEAWGDLENLLDRDRYPAGLTRRVVARFMEGAEEASDLLKQARALLARAESDFDSLHAVRAEIDRTVALQAEVGLWIARIEGEALDPARYQPKREHNLKLLARVKGEFARMKRISFTLERSWITLRNTMGRTFHDFAEMGRLDEALTRLRELQEFVAGGVRGGFALDEAEIRLKRAAAFETVPDMARARDDFKRAGELYLNVADQENWGWRRTNSISREAALVEASRAFELAGDPEGVIRAVSSLEFTTRAQVVLVRFGRALLEQGNLIQARRVLGRVLELGEEILQALDKPSDSVHLGGHYFRNSPPDLLEWLELHPAVDSVNGTGSGRLRFDHGRRTLSWRAPGESRFGKPVPVAEGKMFWIPSGEDPRKRILVTPRRAAVLGESVFPSANGEWALNVTYLELPVDPVQLEARLSLAEASFRLARIPAFGDSSEAAVDFVRTHLGRDGHPRVQGAIALLVENSVEQLYQDAQHRDRIGVVLDQEVAAWREWVRKEMIGLEDAPEERKEWLVQLADSLEDLQAVTSDGKGLKEFHVQAIPEAHQRLPGYYLSAMEILLRRDGPQGRAQRVLERLSRDFLDREAREQLLFLCEHLGNRSPIWRRAMYMRALQKERQAVEVAATDGTRSASDVSEERASLKSEARDIYDRLLRVSALSDAPTRLGRAHLALARIESEAGRLDQAMKWLERLAEVDLDVPGKPLFPADREEVVNLARMAAFARADLARRSREATEAADLYAIAIERYPRSPLVLWGRLQLGSIYEAQGLREDAYREYQKGKTFLLAERSNPEGLGHWLSGDRVRISESIRDTFGGLEAKKAMEALGATNRGRASLDFWERLFDAKLKNLGST